MSLVASWPTTDANRNTHMRMYAVNTRVIDNTEE